MAAGAAGAAGVATEDPLVLLALGVLLAVDQLEYEVLSLGEDASAMPKCWPGWSLGCTGGLMWPLRSMEWIVALR